MVDPTKGVGPIQNVVSTNKTQSSGSQSRETESTGNGEPRDEVTISAEALSLQEAQDASTEVRGVLEQNPDEVLGLDPNFDRNV